MPQLALDNDQRDALVSHLDGVSVAKLMRREPTTDAGEHCGAVQLLASGGLLPVSSRGWSVDHAQQCSGTKPGAQLKPWLKLSPPPAIHADLAAAPTLSTPNKNGPARLVKVGLGEGERFTDPQSATPKDHDERPESSTVRTFAGCSHHSHDLIDCWWVGRIAQALVTRRALLVVARHRGRRPAMASRVVQDRFHRALLLER